MKMNFKTYGAALLTLAMGCAITGCKSDPEFKVKGSVYGAEGKTLLLEKADFSGRWIAVDSTKVGSNGDFSIKSASPGSPEIYRLSYDGRFIYLPVDSVETLTVQTSSAKFGSEYDVDGTDQARRLAAFERELQHLPENPTDLEQIKKNIYTNYIKDGQGSILSYYVLTKIVGGKPLFDPADNNDTRYYAAVATQYQEYRPNDPHARMIKETSLQGMRRRNAAAGKQQVMQATEIDMIDIDLPDENGKQVKLSSLVGKGRPVVVVFAMMNAAESPAFNKQLHDIRDAHGDSFDYYHISFDADQYAWREAARNLTWTTVFDASGISGSELVDYNVTSLPTFFIYNGNGELRDSAKSLPEFKQKIAAF